MFRIAILINDSETRIMYLLLAQDSSSSVPSQLFTGEGPLSLPEKVTLSLHN